MLNLLVVLWALINLIQLKNKPFITDHEQRFKSANLGSEAQPIRVELKKLSAN